MKILTLSNLHGSHQKFVELIAITKLTKPDIIIINGDILPIDQSSLFLQNQFLPDLKIYLKELSSTSTVLIQLGDTDLQIYEEDLDLMCNDKIININKSNYTYEDITFLGVPYITDNPQPIKDWVRTDVPVLSYKTQNSQPLYSSEDGWNNIENLEQHLRMLPTVEDIIYQKLQTIADITKTVWVYHNPPFSSGLDKFNNYNSGSSTCLSLINGIYTNQKQPLLVCCGHAHGSIILNNSWYRQYDKCLCVQPSQIRELLCYCLITITDGEIVYKYHPLERNNQI